MSEIWTFNWGIFWALLAAFAVRAIVRFVSRLLADIWD